DFNKLNRLPPYLLSEVTELTRARRRAGEDIIDLGMGNPDLPTPPHIIDKICEAARDPRNHRYSSSQGLPNLRLGMRLSDRFVILVKGRIVYEGSPKGMALETLERLYSDHVAAA
ncbi:MAG: hypothetical protein IIC82_06055, partial [Chloroflexi bacterium]|nr:hypothetical protein [Chloroflexota bacterium]